VLDVQWGPSTIPTSLDAGAATLDVTGPSNGIGKTKTFLLLGNVGGYPSEVIFDNVVVEIEP
jgi:hypothetical protein